LPVKLKLSNKFKNKHLTPDSDGQFVPAGCGQGHWRFHLATKCESECENKKSESLAPVPILTLFVVPAGLGLVVSWNIASCKPTSCRLKLAGVGSQ